VSRTGQPDISVVICTLNRPVSLARAVASITEQSLPEEMYELIVVDNGTDEFVRLLIHELISRVKNARCIVEPKRGLSHARNAGWKAARAPYVAFLDDDAVVPSGWLKQVVALLSSLASVPTAVGGPIYPLYTGEKPTWFKDAYETRTQGDVPRRLNQEESLSGSNMVIRRSALTASGGFDPRLGLAGSRFLLGEEVELLDRLRRQDPHAYLYYDPRLIVYHAVPAHKMSVGYQLRRAYVSGRSRHIRGMLRGLKPGLRYPIAQAMRLVALLGRGLLRVPRHRRWQCWLEEEGRPVAVALGRIREAMRRAKQSEPRESD